MSSFLEALASWWRRRKLRHVDPRFRQLDDLERAASRRRNMRAIGETYQQKKELLHAQMRKELGLPKPHIRVKAGKAA